MVVLYAMEIALCKIDYEIRYLIKSLHTCTILKTNTLNSVMSPYGRNNAKTMNAYN